MTQSTSTDHSSMESRQASLLRTLHLSSLTGDHYRRILRLAQILCHADCAWIAVLGELGDRVIESLDTPAGIAPTLCERVIASDGFFESNDTGCDPQLRSHPWCSEHELNWLASYPLRNPEGHAIGILALGTSRGHALDLKHRLALVDLVYLLETEMRLDFMLATHPIALRSHAKKSPLTGEGYPGLPEPGHITELLYHTYTRCRLEKRPYALALVELDPLNSLAPQPPTPATRVEVIQSAAARLARTLRTGDLLGTWLNEKLLILLPGVEGEELFGVGDKLVRALDDTVELSSGTVNLTASIGLVGSQNLVERLDHAYLLHAAEDALHKAIQAGRNRARVTLLEDTSAR